MGTMQVMPSTARDPGYGVTPWDGSPDDLTRVGQQYRAAMQQHYGGDLAKMWSAYNAGPGRTDRAVQQYGASWMTHVPTETQNYVARNLRAVGGY